MTCEGWPHHRGLRPLLFRRVDFQCRVIFTCVKFTFANKIEAMPERSLVSVKVEPRSTSRSSLALFYLVSILFTRLKFTCANVTEIPVSFQYPTLKHDFEALGTKLQIFHDFILSKPSLIPVLGLRGRFLVNGTDLCKW